MPSDTHHPRSTSSVLHFQSKKGGRGETNEWMDEAKDEEDEGERFEKKQKKKKEKASVGCWIAAPQPPSMKKNK